MKRRPRRPKVVRVEGDPVRVRWLSGPTRQFPQGYAVGAQYFAKAKGGPRIDVYTPSRAVSRNALVHEMGHDLWRRARLSLRFSPATEELLVEELCVGIIEVLRENPAFARYVLEKK